MGEAEGESVGWADAARVLPGSRRGAEPRTGRGRRTHDGLVSAARSVFEDVGYLDASIDAIVARAGVSHGTFYTYFPSKLAVFRRVAVSLGEDAIDNSDDGESAASTLYERVRRTNHRYLDWYRCNARMMEILEQVSALDDEMRAVRRTVRVQFVERSTRFIARMQAAGLADADLPPRPVASALGSMIDRSAYVNFVLGEPHDFDEMVHVVTMLWIRALGADPDATLRHGGSGDG